MELTKEIWFDTNSMPPKNMIWYRGKGKFYEWRNDVWIVAYDLGNTPSQEELNDIADVIESKTGEELQDKSLSGILAQIVQQDRQTIYLTLVPEQDYLTPESKKAVRDAAARGILFDCLAYFGTSYCAILAWDEELEILSIYDRRDDSILNFECTED